MDDYSDGPIWRAFGLTYARYAVYRRRALQSMPAEWQQRFLDLIHEMESQLPEEALDGDFTIHLREQGRFVKDKLAEYRYPGPFKTTNPSARPGSEGQGA